jgi:SAM-dependent methyltransferase
LHRTITADDPQTALYEKCVSRIGRLTGRHKQEKFNWLDVGAGGGEFSSLLAKKFPNSSGAAIDLHSCPKSLIDITSVHWSQVDINHKEFASKLPLVDLIVSIAVLEHVLHPNLFIANLLQLLRPGGMIYLLCPNNASFASRLLGRRWPYFTPGEHLAIPTPSGVTRCLEREWGLLNGLDKKLKINAGSLMLPYTFRYVMRRLGANPIGKLLPPGWGFPLPVGALETVAVYQQTKCGSTA